MTPLGYPGAIVRADNDPVDIDQSGFGPIDIDQSGFGPIDTGRTLIDPIILAVSYHTCTVSKTVRNSTERVNFKLSE